MASRDSNSMSNVSQSISQSISSVISSDISRDVNQSILPEISLHKVIEEISLIQTRINNLNDNIIKIEKQLENNTKREIFNHLEINRNNHLKTIIKLKNELNELKKIEDELKLRHDIAIEKIFKFTYNKTKKIINNIQFYEYASKSLNMESEEQLMKYLNKISLTRHDINKLIILERLNDYTKKYPVDIFIKKDEEFYKNVNKTFKTDKEEMIEVGNFLRKLQMESFNDDFYGFLNINLNTEADEIYIKYLDITEDMVNEIIKRNVLPIYFEIIQERGDRVLNLRYDENRIEEIIELVINYHINNYSKYKNLYLPYRSFHIREFTENILNILNYYDPTKLKIYTYTKYDKEFVQEFLESPSREDHDLYKHWNLFVPQIKEMLIKYKNIKTTEEYMNFWNTIHNEIITRHKQHLKSLFLALHKLKTDKRFPDDLYEEIKEYLRKNNS